MQDFIFIPIIALFCYSFLILTFMAAKKTPQIKSFLIVLGAMLLWTGGSLCMRLEMWPSIPFWYHVSLLGLMLLPYGYFVFIANFVGKEDTPFRAIWLVVILVPTIINMFTGWFLDSPERIYLAGSDTVRFIYHTTWGVLVLYGAAAVVAVHAILMLLNEARKGKGVNRGQVVPIVAGILILFAGNIGIMLPWFKGFPLDILCGVINAFLLFSALYRRRLFRLTLLVSKSSLYILAATLSLILFANGLGTLEHFIQDKFPIFSSYRTLIIAVIFTIATFGFYYIMKCFIDCVFIKEETLRSETLKEFSVAVSKSLEIDDILDELVTVIKDTLAVRRVYVCIAEPGKDYYQVAYSTSALTRQTDCFKSDNPIVHWLTEHNQCLLMKDFRRTMAYRTMWEKEKQQLEDMEVECVVPLKDDQFLVGIILLTSKERGVSFTFDDINFLDSINSIGSIAVKNCRLYNQAYIEARTDELTGLLNRKYFYEVLSEQCEKTKGRSLALVLLSIDDFKLYNQLYGNKEGDLALQKVAQILRSTVGDDGFVARCNGKEFGIILPYYDILSAKNLAENIRRQILEMNKRATDYALKVLTVSGGISAIPYGASNAKQLLDNADMTLYQVKRQGKNAIKVYSAGEERFAAENAEADGGAGYREGIYSSYASTIYALTAAIDTKDHYTFSHSKNVAYYASQLAFAYGMNDETISIVREGGLLHDIGKIGIPEHILNKPGKLTDEEYEIMKSHVENSIGIIRHLPSLDYVIPAVIGHHERYDGRGYPRRIAGEDISLLARILCIADAFDAMISKRSYKQPYPVEAALKEIEDQAGLQFDPELARLFVQQVRAGHITPVVDEDVPPGKTDSWN